MDKKENRNMIGTSNLYRYTDSTINSATIFFRITINILVRNCIGTFGNISYFADDRTGPDFPQYFIVLKNSPTESYKQKVITVALSDVCLLCLLCLLRHLRHHFAPLPPPAPSAVATDFNEYILS